jgi:hypothetical protein
VLDGWELPAPVTIAVTAVFGLAVYAALLSRLFKSAWRDLAMLIARVVRPNALPASGQTRPSPSAP